MTRRPLHASLTGLFAALVLGLAGPVAAQNVSVTAADPPSGEQDTVGLVVKITGKNFAPGARAEFFKSHTSDPAGITIRNTVFVSSSQIDATIDIAGTAALSLFDIKITNTSGRSGKGSDLFKVTEKGQQVCDADLFRVNAPLQILPAIRSPLTCQSGVSGTLDCAFGTAGLMTATVGDYALVYDSEVSVTGQVLTLVGNSSAGFSILRLSADGTLDTTFGSGGVARSFFTSAADNEFPQALAIQPDGGLVVVGSVPSKANSGAPRLAAVVRLRPDGLLDTSFANGGRLLFSFGSSQTSSWAFGAAVQADGRIVIAGTADTSFAAARLTSTGAFDSSFGSGGRTIISLGTGGSDTNPPRVGGVVLQDINGASHIVIAGDAVHCTSRQMVAVGLNATGAPDLSFGARGDGLVFIDLSNGVERVYGVAVDNAERVVLAGQSNLSNDAGAVRLLSDGSLDTTFGTGGGVRLRFDGLATTVFNMTTDAANQVLLTGGARVPGTPTSDAFVLRLQADGSLDQNFGLNGALLMTFAVGNGDDQGGGVVVQPSGRIVASARAVFNYVVVLGLVP